MADGPHRSLKPDGEKTGKNRATKGVTMRRGSVLLLIAITLMVALVAVGCGESGASLAGDDSPQGILAAAIAASENMTSATGDFEFTMSFDVDTSQMSEEEQAMAGAFLDEPTKVTGTFSSSNAPLAADITVALAMGGESMDVGLKIVGDESWISLLDQWYEAPPELKEAMGEYSEPEAKTAEIMSLMNELGIDPVTWLKDPKLAGEEKIDGTAVYHLTGSPDMAKLMTDGLALMSSEEFMALVDPTGEMGESTGLEEMMPGADELQEAQTQMADMLKNFTIDLWIAKDTSLVHKVAVAAHIVPPAEEGMDMGMSAVDFAVTISLKSINEPVTVEAPASALPYADLEKALEENPEMFMGPFMGLMSGAMGGYGTGGFEETPVSTY
jgi:hypothetical protein